MPVSYHNAGKTIFRGYMIGNRNFVGSWRSYAENIQAIPLEGPFALSRIEETPLPSASMALSSAPAPTPVTTAS